MALRVLLGDESSTIKKVFQLALQDFGVDVRPVNIGVDVAAVAKAFKPDIIFADILLQKKNGYDVCAELKQDAHLRGIPVVLMWSGFMELDEDKFQAHAQLEKPFDVNALRKLVADLVPRTETQSLSQYLTFPKAKAEAEPPKGGVEKAPVKSEEEFAHGPPPKTKAAPGKYRLNMTAEELDPSHIAVEYQMPSEKVQEDEIFKDDEEPAKDEFRVLERKTQPKIAKPPPEPEEEDLDLDLVTADQPATPPPVPSQDMMITATQNIPALTPEFLEKIIRSQSAEVIESVVWKVIPELAERIIERELSRLLKERDA